MSQVGIKNSWSFIEFVITFGPTLKLTNTFINKQTLEEFKSLAVINKDGKVTLVGFSSNLGQLSQQEIIDKKDSLKVVELESGNYKLCLEGNSKDSWETINLGI